MGHSMGVLLLTNIYYIQHNQNRMSWVGIHANQAAQTLLAWEVQPIRHGLLPPKPFAEGAVACNCLNSFPKANRFSTLVVKALSGGRFGGYHQLIALICEAMWISDHMLKPSDEVMLISSIACGKALLGGHAVIRDSCSWLDYLLQVKPAQSPQLGAMLVTIDGMLEALSAPAG